MVISDDTAALVAAQLTVAWATRSGARPRGKDEKITADVLDAYDCFLSQVTNLGRAQQD